MELEHLKSIVMGLKDKLVKGDQRHLASILGMHPNTINLAFNGFVNDVEKLNRLRNECENLLAKRKALVA